jgi:hypothetical protein
MVIELGGVQFGLKSNARLQNQVQTTSDTHFIVMATSIQFKVLFCEIWLALIFFGP